MDVYLRAKYEVSSIILTSFNAPPLTSKRTPKKPTQIKVKEKKNRTHTIYKWIENKAKYWLETNCS